MIIKKKFLMFFYFICSLLFFGIFLLCFSGCSKSSKSPFFSQGNENPAIPVATSVFKPIDGFLVYENAEYNIRIQYPGDWEKMDGENGVAFIIPKEETSDGIFEGFNLLFEKMYGLDMNIDEYIRITKEGMKQYMPGFELIDSGESTLGGHPAVQMIFNGVHESKAMKFLSMFLIRNENVYTLSFNTLQNRFDAFQEILRKIIDSFQFLS